MDSTTLRRGRPLPAASDRPLLAGRARPWAGGVLACCATTVAVLGVLFAHQRRADWLDHAVDAPIINALASHQMTAAWLAAPGSLIPAVLASAAIVVACLLTGRLSGAVLAACAVAVSAGVTDGLLKPLVDRTYLGELTYPSGHTTAITALAATVTFLLLVPPQPAGAGAVRALRFLIPAGAYVLAGAVAIGVIGLRWHYLTDIAGGAAVGIGTVCALALILDLPAVRRWLARIGGSMARAVSGSMARAVSGQTGQPDPRRQR